MNNLMTKEVKMTSRDISELTGKGHKNVMRDIRKEIKELGEISQLIFEPSNFTDSRGKQQPQFTFGKKGSDAACVEICSDSIYRYQKK